jgi:hypothetical protein
MMDMEKYECKACGGPIAESDIHRDKGFVKCGWCRTLYGLHESMQPQQEQPTWVATYGSYSSASTYQTYPQTYMANNTQGMYITGGNPPPGKEMMSYG